MKPIAVSLGDAAGIGPEIIAAAWRAQSPPFVVIGASEAFASLAPTQTIKHPDAAEAIFAKAIPVIAATPARIVIAPGRPAPETDALARQAFERAVHLTLTKQTRALVSAPLGKRALIRRANADALDGHTEYLGRLAPDPNAASGPVMTLHGRGVRVALATNHIAWRNIGARLQTLGVAGLLAIAHTLARDMLRLIGKAHPHIALCALNPHAGEDGLLGDEEATLLVPALEAMRREGLRVSGPHPADSIFTPRLRKGWDIALCLYHDQALAPLKALDPHAVNITFGIAITRVSPDHGPAYAIAGKGLADPTSFVRALAAADSIAAA